MYKHTIRNNEVVINFVIDEYKGLKKKSNKLVNMESVQFGSCTIFTKIIANSKGWQLVVK